jgi:Subtilisin inhibitor-like
MAERPAQQTRLTITVWDHDSAQPHRWQLACDPPGGDHPDPAAACAALAAASAPFAPVPPGRNCAQVFFGPQRAEISGTWLGQPVHTTYRRTDSCQEQKWQELADVFRAGHRPAR